VVVVVLVVVVMLAGATVACSRIGRPSERDDEAAPERTILMPATGAPGVEADRLCEAAARDEFVELVECDVLDLFLSERRECPEGPVDEGSPPCEVPGPRIGDRVGWALTLEPARDRLRTLTIYSGSERLDARVRASAADPPWSTATVCPSDITGDGLVDLVALFRSAADDDEVIVEAVDLAEAPTRVLTLPPQDFEPTKPQGCRSDLVARLRYDADSGELELAPEDERTRNRPLTA
jgi:hypothetical protein